MEKAISKNTIVLFVCLPIFCINNITSFSWDYRGRGLRLKVGLVWITVVSECVCVGGGREGNVFEKSVGGGGGTSLSLSAAP